MLKDKKNKAWMNSLRERAQASREELVSFRRELHRYPEVGFSLEKTASLVEEALKDADISCRRCAGTGIVASVRGEHPGPVVAFRADMDALSMDDAKDVPYRSMVPGKMHAAGHDAHTAILLGTARLLREMRKEFRGTALFIFEPAEETEGGALPMIRDGALDNPLPECIFGYNVSPELPAGKVRISPGKVYAASDMFDIQIVGEGCHGAYPHKGRDALAIAASLVTLLQQGVSREVDPVQPAVLTVGTFNAGEARNAVAREAFLSGIIRTLDSGVRKHLREWLRKTVEGVAEGMGARGISRLRESYPCVVNHEGMVNYVQEVGEALLGRDFVRTSQECPSMEVDDFSYFAQRIPGVFYFIGTGNEARGITYPLHSPRFDVDEDALPLGVALNVALALRYAEHAEEGDKRKS
ncbi:MAG TPA: M20 family metallopeptidase [Synergistaceae bacterium]|nr:M20 family metallopeptidase [Synergistaceae bacterium]HPQ37750.1 M20 family metallopeptidase [Synergistaceae bacterium]